MKKSVLWIISDLIFLVVFNIVFFITGGTEHPLSVWISYGFIHLAYILLLFTPAFVRRTSNTSVLAFPLYSISSLYFIVVFIVGLAFIILHPESYKTSLVIQIVLFGIYVAIMMSHMIANEETADNNERHEIELRYVKDGSAQLNRIASEIEDKQLRKKVEHIYDVLHSSPVKSNNSVRDYELLVLDLIDELEMCIANSDFTTAELTINRIERNANERNRRLKFDN